MAITLICPDKDPNPWIKALKALDPDLDIRIWPDDTPREDVELALTWAHPKGVLKAYPGLRCISSMGAGVDHLLSDPDLPRDVPLVRLKDKELVKDMAEFLLLSVLFYFRQFDLYQQAQSEGKWMPMPPLEKKDLPVGIMGMGQLGATAADSLKTSGFSVAGWKRTPASDGTIDLYIGDGQLQAFLARTRILICLLPLTDQTRDILNRDCFDRLPKGALLINAARGGHLNEKDLIDALDQGQLSGAILDVFKTEPLPAGHPFWSHPKIRITPHVSSQTKPSSVAPQVLENLRRLRQGLPLLNPVSLDNGY